MTEPTQSRREDFEQLVTEILFALDDWTDLPDGPSVDDAREAVMRELLAYPEPRTPLHELVDLCREQGLALDFAIYGPDEGQHPDSDDTKSTYLGGARITGHDGDPMDVISAGVRARRDAANG